jgi:2-polyprenyl-6-methoxyphenol hydroxylase-like FAD-dependent oxidoreductase
VGGDGKRVAGFGTKVFTDLAGGRYVTLSRSGLSRLIFEKLGDGIETIFGDEIVSLAERADHVAVGLKRGGERRFGLVVGADGLHSAVRRLAFGPQAQYEKHLGYVVAAFEAENYPHRDEDIYVMCCEPGRVLGRVTLRDNRTLFLFVFAEGLGQHMPDLPAQKALLRVLRRRRVGVSADPRRARAHGRALFRSCQPDHDAALVERTHCEPERPGRTGVGSGGILGQSKADDRRWFRSGWTSSRLNTAGRRYCGSRHHAR